MVRELGTGRSRYDTLGSLGLSGISVGQARAPEERIHAGRLLIPITWFDAQACATGLERLRAYRKRWSRATLSWSGPLHDRASHGADAFGEFAVARRGAAEARRPPRPAPSGALSWMG
jgi:phage terminase large subunit